MLRTILLLIGAWLLAGAAQAQQDSCSLRISLLTCSPGEELYSTFGHTAIRVEDPRVGIDEVYNYGTFEFGPDFYMQFIRGKLRYSLSVEPFPSFLYSYQLERRSIVAQYLDISCDERQRLYGALKLNAQEEHRYYKYDFVYDNCTTRAMHIIANNTTALPEFKDIRPFPHPSFRDQIHFYLDIGKQYWSKAGIDFLLGARLDRKGNAEQYLFLPELLKKGMDSATISASPLVQPAVPVLEVADPEQGGSLFTPGVVFTALFLLVVISSLYPGKRWKWSAYLDAFYFLVLGLAGWLLLFMWFGTDHYFCADNFNLLWAMPTHLVGAFILLKGKGRVYFRITAWLTVVLVLLWFFLPQSMHPAFLPLAGIAGLRSWIIAKNAR